MQSPLDYKEMDYAPHSWGGGKNDIFPSEHNADLSQEKRSPVSIIT